MTKKSTTNEDIIQILKDFISMVDARFRGLETDNKDLKSEMTDFKSELSGVKFDITEVKSDITGIKSELIGVKSETVGIKSRLTYIESSQRQTNTRLEHIEGSVEAMSNDIKELYALAT